MSRHPSLLQNSEIMTQLPRSILHFYWQMTHEGIQIETSKSYSVLTLGFY